MGEISFEYWIKASRPKTLPVSMAPVIMSVTYTSIYMKINWLAALICLAFAVMAQMTSNLVNDYSDGVKGIDENRVGPVTMVASGLIPAKKMYHGIIVLFVLTFLLGCTLMFWGGLVLLPFGIIIMLCALAYSAGPFPLSTHALGDLAVVIFYGIVPCALTFFVQTGMVNYQIIMAGLAIGLVTDNLLIVNNYRDIDEDLRNGKKTTANIFGRGFIKKVYFCNPLIAVVLGFAFLKDVVRPLSWLIAVIPFLAYSTLVSFRFSKANGMEFNKLIGMSSLESIIFALTVTIVMIV